MLLKLGYGYRTYESFPDTPLCRARRIPVHGNERFNQVSHILTTWKWPTTTAFRHKLAAGRTGSLSGHTFYKSLLDGTRRWILILRVTRGVMGRLGEGGREGERVEVQVGGVITITAGKLKTKCVAWSRFFGILWVRR